MTDCYVVSLCVQCGAQCDPDLRWGCPHATDARSLCEIEVVRAEPMMRRVLAAETDRDRYREALEEICDAYMRIARKALSSGTREALDD